MASNLEGSRLDSQFVLKANHSQHQMTQNQIAASLKRAVRANKSKMEHLEKVVPAADLRNQLRALYSKTYSDKPEFEEQTSRVLHASIKKMYAQSTQKRKPKHSRSLPRQITDDDSEDESNEFVKPRKKRQKKEISKISKKENEQFTPNWNASILKKKLKVFWPLDSKFYRGVVSKVNDKKTKSVLVKYRDGDKEWLNLRNEKFTFYTVTNMLFYCMFCKFLL